MAVSLLSTGTGAVKWGEEGKGGGGAEEGKEKVTGKRRRRKRGEGGGEEGGRGDSTFLGDAGNVPEPGTYLVLL